MLPACISVYLLLLVHRPFDIHHCKFEGRALQYCSHSNQPPNLSAFGKDTPASRLHSHFSRRLTYSAPLSDSRRDQREKTDRKRRCWKKQQQQMDNRPTTDITGDMQYDNGTYWGREQPEEAINRRERDNRKTRRERGQMGRGDR